MRAWKQKDGSVYEETDVKPFVTLDTDSKGTLDISRLEPGRYFFKAEDLAGTVDIPAQKLKMCTQQPTVIRMSSSKPHQKSGDPRK